MTLAAPAHPFYLPGERVIYLASLMTDLAACALALYGFALLGHAQLPQAGIVAGLGIGVLCAARWLRARAWAPIPWKDPAAEPSWLTGAYRGGQLGMFCGAAVYGISAGPVGAAAAALIAAALGGFGIVRAVNGFASPGLAPRWRWWRVVDAVVLSLLCVIAASSTAPTMGVAMLPLLALVAAVGGSFGLLELGGGGRG